MTDDRPRPSYGEYATPEQQAAAMGVHRIEPATPSSPVSAPVPLGETAATPAPASRRWDLLLTSLLLAYGLWSVVTGLTQYAHLSTVAQKFYETQGMGAFTTSNPALGNTLGLTINISNLVIFVIVALLAYRMLRRGRIAFWVPLAGGALAAIIAAACLVTFLFTDPGFATHLSSLQSAR